jgi:hypothetical protein
MPTTVEDMFRYYTNRAGELSRSLGLVGVALIGALHGASAGEGDSLFSHPLDFWLKLAVITIVLSLAVDLAQYVVGVYQWRKEFKDSQSAQADAVSRTCPINTATCFIYTKLFLTTVSYALIFIFVAKSPLF